MLIFNCDTSEGRVFAHKRVREIVAYLEGRASLEEVQVQDDIPQCKAEKTLEELFPPMVCNKKANY